ncbi:MAG: SIMPL domain-containing protein [Cellulomonadaceae bacterium]|nr:SIMPL domain-containing protein [Cellulomonadaceae bacterium]
MTGEPGVDGPSRYPRGGLTTTGVGVVDVVPDVAVVRLGAQVTDPSAPAALAAASAASAAILEALVAAGADRTDLRTAATSSWTDPGVEPFGDQPGRGPRTTVSLTLEATLRDTATAGAVVAGALEAAGEPGRLESTTFRVADTGPAVVQARAAAFAEAVAAAEQLAVLAGRPLGAVLDVREESEASGGPVALMARAARDVPLEAGQQQVRVRLVVRHAWGDNAFGASRQNG